MVTSFDPIILLSLSQLDTFHSNDHQFFPWKKENIMFDIDHVV